MKALIEPINISFKTFTQSDIQSVLAIENLSFESPWSEKKFIDSLKNEQVLANLILQNKQILGYGIVQFCSDSADLLNICIHPKQQNLGLGKALFSYMQKGLQRIGVNDIFLEVRQSNQAAEGFYQALGFEQINLRKNYYTNGEDAKIMRISFNNKI
ncbi:MAG: ribosomal protein S18-alanine N-acetyltransferase [Candidatus Thioglobus sp.]|nr:ribosomal protein S18-alanine N-acetyltransferase [Candidatus Thioglobus sp.]